MLSWDSSFHINHANVIIFLNTGEEAASKSLLLNAMMVLPIHNFGMSISRHYDIQHTKFACTSKEKVSSVMNCSKAGKYLGLPKAHQS